MPESRAEKFGLAALVVALIAAALGGFALLARTSGVPAKSASPACSCDTSALERELKILKAELARGSSGSSGSAVQGPGQWQQKWSVPLPDGVSSVSVAHGAIRTRITDKRLELENSDPKLAGEEIQVLLVLPGGQTKSLKVRIPKD